MIPPDVLGLGALAMTLVNSVALFVRTGRNDSKAVGENLQRIQELTTRVTDVEGGQRETSKSLNQLTPAIASLTEKVAGLDRFMSRDLDELKHAMRNVRAGLEGLASRLGRSPQA